MFAGVTRIRRGTTRSPIVRRRVQGDPTWRRVRQVQIPIAIVGFVVGVWEAVTGDVVLGVLLATICFIAAGLALTGLRNGRP
jgi:hypothetical protein